MKENVYVCYVVQTPNDNIVAILVAVDDFKQLNSDNSGINNSNYNYNETLILYNKDALTLATTFLLLFLPHYLAGNAIDCINRMSLCTNTLSLSQTLVLM